MGCKYAGSTRAIDVLLERSGHKLDATIKEFLMRLFLVHPKVGVASVFIKEEVAKRRIM